jgi:hypothetical protein
MLLRAPCSEYGRWYQGWDDGSLRFYAGGIDQLRASAADKETLSPSLWENTGAKRIQSVLGIGLDSRGQRARMDTAAARHILMAASGDGAVSVFSWPPSGQVIAGQAVSRRGSAIHTLSPLGMTHWVMALDMAGHAYALNALHVGMASAAVQPHTADSDSDSDSDDDDDDDLQEFADESWEPAPMQVSMCRMTSAHVQLQVPWIPSAELATDDFGPPTRVSHSFFSAVKATSSVKSIGGATDGLGAFKVIVDGGRNCTLRLTTSLVARPPAAHGASGDVGRRLCALRGYLLGLGGSLGSRGTLWNVSDPSRAALLLQISKPGDLSNDQISDYFARATHCAVDVSSLNSDWVLLADDQHQLHVLQSTLPYTRQTFRLKSLLFYIAAGVLIIATVVNVIVTRKASSPAAGTTVAGINAQIQERLQKLPEQQRGKITQLLSNLSSDEQEKVLSRVEQMAPTELEARAKFHQQFVEASAGLTKQETKDFMTKVVPKLGLSERDTLLREMAAQGTASERSRMLAAQLAKLARKHKQEAMSNKKVD